MRSGIIKVQGKLHPRNFKDRAEGQTFIAVQDPPTKHFKQRLKALLRPVRTQSWESRRSNQYTAASSACMLSTVIPWHRELMHTYTAQ
eukprot:3624120-Amphidinium_carterae.1